jgi:hypothetical protein
MKWREISSDEAVQEGMEDMPSSICLQMECQVVAAEVDYLRRRFLGKVASFVLNKISSFRNIPEMM